MRSTTVLSCSQTHKTKKKKLTAKPIAMSDSVTVSMGDEIKGVLRVMPFIVEEVLVSVDVKSYKIFL